MKLYIEVIDNVLFINTESGSGAKYSINSKSDIIKYIEKYIDTYVEEL